MVIKSIELADYRNYEQLDLKFDKRINILYGDNAQGKPIFWKRSIWLPRPSPTRAARTGRS